MILSTFFTFREQLAAEPFRIASMAQYHTLMNPINITLIMENIIKEQLANRLESLRRDFSHDQEFCDKSTALSKRMLYGIKASANNVELGFYSCFSMNGLR
jgi:hypothetical protein